MAGKADEEPLRKWHCPSKDASCQKVLGELWATSEGRVLRVVAPPQASTQEFRKVVGLKRGHPGGTVCAEFVEAITETSVMAICGKCGPQELDISDLSVR